MSGPVTIREIVDALYDEATRIEDVQAICVDLGWRAAPDAQQMRRARLFLAASDMLARLSPFQDEIKRLLARREDA